MILGPYVGAIRCLDCEETICCHYPGISALLNTRTVIMSHKHNGWTD